jgi:hypothetical protein
MPAWENDAAPAVAAAITAAIVDVGVLSQLVTVVSRNRGISACRRVVKTGITRLLAGPSTRLLYTPASRARPVGTANVTTLQIVGPRGLRRVGLGGFAVACVG